MRYEHAESSRKPTIDRIVSIVNFILIIVIAFCVNYMVVDLLF